MAMSHVTAMSHLAYANTQWHCQHLLPSQMIWRSIYRSRSSRRKSSCFTRKTTSHPAHTSNLGKVGPVPYIFHYRTSHLINEYQPQLSNRNRLASALRSRLNFINVVLLFISLSLIIFSLFYFLFLFYG